MSYLLTYLGYKEEIKLSQTSRAFTVHTVSE